MNNVIFQCHGLYQNITIWYHQYDQKTRERGSTGRWIEKHWKCAIRIVMPCSSNPCIMPSVDLLMELLCSKSSVCVTGAAWADGSQALICNADGGEGTIWATARGSLLCAVVTEWHEASTGKESHWMWQCCETNQQQHSKWITETEAWCLGKEDRLVVCVSMLSCVYVGEADVSTVICNFFLCVRLCLWEIFFFCLHYSNFNCNTTWFNKQWLYFNTPSTPQRVTPLNSFWDRKSVV